MQNNLRIIWFAVLAMGLGQSLASRRPICQRPILLNGDADIRREGMYDHVYFTCNPPYELIGHSDAFCWSEEWSKPAPVCAKPGCPPVSGVENAVITTRNNGAVAIALCNDGFTLAGPRMAYCNGTTWNQALGTCKDKLDVPLSCDFEHNECGWTTNMKKELPWIRSSSANAAQSGAGPTRDHTMNEANKGHFMLYDWKNARHVTRMISPFYPAELSKGACLQFAYYVYGDGVDYLSLYVQTVSKNIFAPINSKDPYTTEIPVSEGNVWKMASFRLDALDENFQFEFETVGGPIGGIAIDDIKLMKGSEC